LRDSLWQSKLGGMSVSDPKRHWIVRKVSETRGLVLGHPLRARAAGIRAVTHEASNRANADVDIEAFGNLALLRSGRTYGHEIVRWTDP
jgi:hypothetical protein